MEDRLHWLGLLDGQDLVDAYATMDLFVFASLSETQGMVVSEAMAAGTPVVALIAPGVDDVVNDDNGLLLDQNTTADSFANQCDALLKNRDILARKSRMALRTAEQFSVHRSGKALHTYYQKTIDNFDKVSERHEELPVLDSIAAKLKAEWELLQQKLSAVSQTLSDDQHRSQLK